MLTDRSGRLVPDVLPSSLQQSPDRDDILLFAPMSTSPKNDDSQQRNFEIGGLTRAPTIDSGHAYEHA